MTSSGSFPSLLYLEQHTSQVTDAWLYIRKLFYIFLIETGVDLVFRFDFHIFPGYYSVARDGKN